MISNYIHRIIQYVTLATAFHIAKQCNHHSHPMLLQSVMFHLGSSVAVLAL